MVALGEQSHLNAQTISNVRALQSLESKRSSQTLDSKAHSFAAVLLGDVIIRVAS